MKNLNKLRSQIDLIDDKLLDLLKKRSKLSLQIGKIKKSENDGINLFRPERQVQILARLFLKKGKLFTAKDILSIWKEIFSHQTRLQGKLNFLIPDFLTKSEKKILYSSFGDNFYYDTFQQRKKACFWAKKKHILIILPFPGKLKRNDWWLDDDFKGLYIVASVPFICKKNSLPKLLVISRYKPILEGRYSIVYKTTNKINKLNIKKITNLKSNYLFISNNISKNSKMEMLGAFPNLKLSQNNEKN